MADFARRLSVFLALALLAGGASARADSLDPPAPAAPANGASVSANPEFTWAAVPRAAKYRVQVSTTSAYTTTAWTADVFGTTATPTSELPLGTLHWRVASIDSGGTVGAYSGDQTFTKGQAAAPQLIAPADGATLAYPTDQAVLSWHPVAGMKTYRVEIDDEPTFTAPLAYTTASTSFALPVALSSNVPRYWRVQGVATDPAVTTAWSDNNDPRTFSIAWPGGAAPSLLTPLDSLVTNIDDFDFSWTPVPGAADYELQTSTNVDFTANVTSQITDAAHYRPTNAMTQDQYYWRVRARQANTEPTAWSPVKTYKREWLDNTGEQARPTVTVQDSDLVALGTQMERDKILISWTAVPKASYYELDVSTDPSFLAASTTTSMVHRTCQTPHTEWTPYLAGTYKDTAAFSTLCDWAGTPTTPSTTRFLTTGTTYYVRVRAIDELPGGGTPLTTLWSNAAREDESSPPDTTTFTVVDSTSTGTDASQPAQITSSPDSADTPTLKWNPVAGAAAYLVALARDSSFNSRVMTPASPYFVTTNTMLRIKQVLLDNSVGQPYFWFVLPCSSWTSVAVNTCTVGENQAINISGKYASFNKLGRAVTGLTGAPTQTDTVALSWQDQLTTSPDGGGAKWYELEVRNAANTVVDTVQTDATGYTPIHKTYADGSYTWHVRAIDASGTPLAWSSDATFQKRSSVPTPLAPAAFETLPVLRWTPTSFAASYDVEVYRGVDPAFPAGNKIAAASATGLPYPSTALSAALPADTYSWRVRQVDAGGRAGPWSTAIQPFTVGGTKPSLTAPGNGAGVQTASLVYRWAAVPGAVRYKVESSTSPGFGALVDSATTPATSFAPTVPHVGNTVYYWRVSALNANDDVMATSGAQSFTAITPPLAPVVTAALQGQSIGATWGAPDNGGSAITGYVVRFRQTGSTAWTELSVAGDVLSTTLGTLPANTKYDVQVAAVNAAGTGAFSATANAITAAVPGVPNGLKVTAAGGGLSVTWTPPTTTGGAPITDYVVRLTKVGGTTASTETTVTTTSATLSSLLSGTTYTVEVAADNAAGRGPFASGQGTTAGAPAASVLVTLAGGPTIAFGKPAMLRGTLKTSAGAAIVGVPLAVEYRPAGGTTWAKLATVTTTVGGAFSTVARPLVNTEYRATVAGVSSTPLAVGVAPRVSLLRSTVRGRVGSRVRVTGKVAPGSTGKRVALECLAGGRWAKQVAGRTLSGGAFRLALMLSSRASKTCRVSIAADATHTAGHSSRLVVAGR